MISNQNLTISIVTVTYNAEAFLEETIRSVIEQNYDYIEYIIIDGGSTDTTLDIIKKYESYITYWISEEDKGIYDAMNKAIDQASGTWINFINAGDTFTHINVLNSLVNKLDKRADVICAGVNVVENNAKLFYEPPSSIDNIHKRFPCNHQAMFVKTNIIKRYKFNTTYKIAADADLMLKLHHNRHIFALIDIAVVNYLKDGFWNDNIVKAHIELLYIASQYPLSDIELIEHSSFLELQQITNLYKVSSINGFIKQLDELKISHEKIAIYGNGLIGKMLFLYFKQNSCIVFDKFNYNNVNIHNITTIQKYKFDIILISVLGSEETIKNDLLKLGVSSKKIIILI